MGEKQKWWKQLRVVRIKYFCKLNNDLHILNYVNRVCRLPNAIKDNIWKNAIFYFKKECYILNELLILFNIKIALLRF